MVIVGAAMRKPMHPAYGVLKTAKLFAQMHGKLPDSQNRIFRDSKYPKFRRKAEISEMS